ncbi:NAD-dependent malic enzyme [Mycolicibacter kumamotonensis]|jgi:malate dehydrogenase (oxaloacetate-decarboxylating)|uniref:Putative malate oxidoreductase [NAD] n=1 Tax=Mycolicibacter kumamotonensis TaxID=354243 RepID=A0A1B8S9L1_9MYCO|nr:NAD-dependent malic enzyme [Mycolicibacter kumamotonensis]OBY29423.1 malate dehydrogenase [Mycolicibacter kumamotonensis]ORA75556.1 NAD-dependent malic enzyme [Mycolicibacter kumamotonensis]
MTGGSDEEGDAVAHPGRQRRGQDLLFDALTTKGTAFTHDERCQYGLLGLLPVAVKTIAEQAAHTYTEFSTRHDDLDKHIYLRALQDRNETLFYRLLSEHIGEMLPIVYTPTVGEACRQFSEIYRRPRGLFVSYPDRDRLREVLRNRREQQVDVIVVTDGQRILGLGDQGIGGMGIPIGKLSLYTLIGGIAPARTLPIILDVGTDNVELLDDPQYLGWRHRRISDEEYYAFVEDFVTVVEEELPGVLLQWEDFATAHALPLLERYRGRLLTFNDDIQGTAAVTLGALHGAVRAAGRPLVQQQVVMFGAGSAGIGVLEMIRQEMVAEGLSDSEAAERLWAIDVDGLLTDDRTDLSDSQRRFAQPASRVSGWDGHGLADVVHHVDVGILVGLSTAAGAFTEQIIRALAAKTDHPIIFPLSNPTSRAEAHPAELDAWTNGRALIATGSPFAPVQRGDQTRHIAQCNNVYIFPAIGLAVTAARATRVTDAMMLAAATTLGDASPALSDPSRPLLPAFEDLPEITTRIATAVAIQAVRDKVAPETSEEQLAAAVRRTRWIPEYPTR